jgi:hypothetical protein
VSHFVGARLWEPIMPLNRVDRYEDPLDTALSGKGWGKVTGGGSQLTEHNEIEFVEIDLELANLDEAIDLVKQVLEEAGAPVGSELRYDFDAREVVLSFGTQEGLAIYLDGVTLPDAVYQTTNINELAGEITARISPVGGAIRGSWVGPTETSIYIYGPSSEAMFEQLEPLLRAYPLCQNARVVVRHGKPSLGTRTVRLSRHSA